MAPRKIYVAVDDAVSVGEDDTVATAGNLLGNDSDIDAMLRSGELSDYFETAGVTRQFWPERLHVLDEMPLTPSGKIQKFKLREAAQADS